MVCQGGGIRGHIAAVHVAGNGYIAGNMQSGGRRGVAYAQPEVDGIPEKAIAAAQGRAGGPIRELTSEAGAGNGAARAGLVGAAGPCPGSRLKHLASGAYRLGVHGVKGYRGRYNSGTQSAAGDITGRDAGTHLGPGKGPVQQVVKVCVPGLYGGTDAKPQARAHGGVIVEAGQGHGRDTKQRRTVSAGGYFPAQGRSDGREVHKRYWNSNSIGQFSAKGRGNGGEVHVGSGNAAGQFRSGQAGYLGVGDVGVRDLGGSHVSVGYLDRGDGIVRQLGGGDGTVGYGAGAQAGQRGTVAVEFGGGNVARHGDVGGDRNAGGGGDVAGGEGEGHGDQLHAGSQGYRVHHDFQKAVICGVDGGGKRVYGTELYAEDAVFQSYGLGFVPEAGVAHAAGGGTGAGQRIADAEGNGFRSAHRVAVIVHQAALVVYVVRDSRRVQGQQQYR